MEKETYYIVCFHSTQRAIRMEREIAARHEGIRLVPVPPEIRAGCGLGLKINPGSFKLVFNGDMKEELLADGIYIVQREAGRRSVAKWEEN